MRLLSAEGLKAKGIDFSKTQLWRLTKAGRFPKAVMLGYKSRAWIEAEIDAWIETKVKERDRT